MRWLAGGCLLLLLAATAAGLYLTAAYRAPVPDDPPELAAPGLSAPATIRYDTRRRPFVEAADFTDAVFVQGWLHARERFWQMELLRRAGKGRLAELLGAGMLGTDVEITLAGVPRLARRMIANADADTLAVVDAYVAGINLALETLVPPLEFELLRAQPARWQREDVFAVGGIMAFQSGRNMRNELLRMSLAADLDPELAALFSDRSAPVLTDGVDFDRYLAMERSLDQSAPYFQPPLLGSNGWVVAPARSASGNALFAFDSHDGWGLPALFYEVHLFFGADGARESVRGFSVPGLPGAINGFNDFMAWGFTNIGDSQDLFIETRDPENPMRFKGRAGWYEAEVESVQIPVAGADPHRLEIVHTENGPLIQQLATPFPALVGTGNRGALRARRALPSQSCQLTYPRFMPRSIASRHPVRTSPMRTWRATSFSVRSGCCPYGAKVTGWCRWRRTNRTAAGSACCRSGSRRARSICRVWRIRRPVIWSGPMPVCCRSRRWCRRTTHRDTGRPGWKSCSAAEPSVSFEQMARWQGDWRNKQAEWLLPQMLKEISGTGAVTGEFQQLSEWLAEPVNAPDLAAPLLFDQWYLALARTVFEPALGPDRFRALLANSYVLNHALDRLILDDGGSPWWAGRKSAMVRAAFDAMREESQSGRTWGEAHQLLFRHEMSGAVPGLSLLIDRGPYAWGGGNPTVGRARYRYDRPFTATGGATVRLVIEMTEPMRIGAVMPGGQSGHPASPHYDDQLTAWMDRELDVVAGTPEGAGEVVTRLLP